MSSLPRKWLLSSAAVLVAILAIVTTAWIHEERAYGARRAVTEEGLKRLAAQISEFRRSYGRFPTNLLQLATEFKTELPRDGWGGAITYEIESTNHFRLTAMSPYPHLDTFEYDCDNSRMKITIVPF